ncbi:hypothetical protein FV242_32955 [Methylobacterium sp. WL64]|uniref:hypothetical protein n=1 Tax=Methylobacterium sp. WL64 TaxID=2603894 RepID=UPI0011CC04A5|nr:hypothetical protein [Methylobacterium sp. WL64]TXM96837.1 hypothetical protein FV242_32955 [Methylobacterium sp. WL64]
MAGCADTPPDGAAPPTRGSPTRRRLLALLSGAPGSALEIGGATHRADPMLRLFAEFRVLVDRHAAALAACDRLEAALLTEVGSPRVRLPHGGDGTPRYAADAATIAEAVPPGRLRDRRQWVLRRRQGRWDAAACEAGLTAAQVHEAALDGAALDASDALLTTPAWTREAVVLKLLVLLSTQEPGPSACETSPWRELRLILLDLRGLATTDEAAR